MSDRRDDILDTLSESKRLVGDMELPVGEEFSLHDILTEFGQDEAEPAPKQPEPAAPAQSRAKVLQFPKFLAHGDGETPTQPPEEKAAPAPKPRAKSPSAWVEPPEPEEPRLSIEDVMASTVDAVLEEEGETLLEEHFSLREQVGYVLANGKEKLQKLSGRLHAATAPREPGRRAEPPEPEMEQAVREERRSCKKRRRQLILSAVPLVLLLAATVIDTWWQPILPALWRTSALLRGASLGGGLLLVCLLAMDVWREAVAGLKARRVTCETAAAVNVLAVLGECVRGAVSGTLESLPLAAPAALLVWLCLLGRFLESRTRRDIYRLADLGGRPPYGVAVTGAGLCKQRGRLDGFYHRSRRPDPAAVSQNILLPLLLSACTVLAGVVCLGSGEMERFLWVWSALLSASLPLGLPLCGTLALNCLGRRLNRCGCAVAGYAGARSLGGTKRIVLTDADIFPPGSVSPNGLKLNKEEISKVVTYAATVARAAESPLQPIFEQFLSREGGTHCAYDDLHFYEDGGVGVTIHGESVKMGSAYFMKKSRVPLLRDTNMKVKTGVFLAVDNELVAVFALKYRPGRNVDWALRALRRSRIEPVLAVRDGNVTPGLIKSMFGVDTKPVYPDVSTRLSLSELSRDTVPESVALIYREGLMSFAEVVVGSRRCCRMVRLSTVLCWLGSLSGLLLSYYLVSAAAFGALAAGYVLAFALLWLLPAVLLGDMARRY